MAHEHVDTERHVDAKHQFINISAWLTQWQRNANVAAAKVFVRCNALHPPSQEDA